MLGTWDISLNLSSSIMLYIVFYGNHTMSPKISYDSNDDDKSERYSFYN